MNTGFLVDIGNHFTMNIFGEYSYKKLRFHSEKSETFKYIVKSVQLGGITLGVALGYFF